MAPLYSGKMLKNLQIPMLGWHMLSFFQLCAEYLYTLEKMPAFITA